MKPGLGRCRYRRPVKSCSRDGVEIPLGEDGLSPRQYGCVDIWDGDPSNRTFLSWLSQRGTPAR